VKTVTTHEAKTHLSRLLAAVEKGEEIVILRGNRPVGKLVPFKPTAKMPRRPKVGTITSGPISYTPDCFDALTEKEMEELGFL
jgi:prevent-host-death family protein